jgi:hypothetical protein
MRKTFLRTALLLVAAGGFSSCDSPTSSSTDELDVTFSVTPDPAIATASTGVKYKVTNADDSISYYDYAYRAPFTLHIQENAGMPLDIASIDLTVQQATGGIVVTPSGGDSLYFKFNSAAATKHINANGSADIGFDVWYDLPNGGKEALITVGLKFQYQDQDDDDGDGEVDTYTYSDVAEVQVAP